MPKILDLLAMKMKELHRDEDDEKSVTFSINN